MSFSGDKATYADQPSADGSGSDSSGSDSSGTVLDGTVLDGTVLDDEDFDDPAADPGDDTRAASSAAKWGMAGLLVAYAGLGSYCVVSALGQGTGPDHAQGAIRSVSTALGQAATGSTAKAQPATRRGSAATAGSTEPSATSAAIVAGKAYAAKAYARGQAAAVAPKVEALTAVSATAIGPAGASGDHPRIAPLILDGNSATAWVTHWYASAHFGNLDIAVEAGAALVIVINPIVPYINERADGGDGPPERRISDMGFSKIGYQAFKLLGHRRLHELASMWEERYPGVDIVLIEPEPTDELMFETPIMSFSSRIEIARHGFQSVTYHLLDQYEHYSEIWARHGIEISERRVRRVVDHFEAEEEQVGAWRKILEGTTGALLRQSGSAG